MWKQQKNIGISYEIGDALDLGKNWKSLIDSGVSKVLLKRRNIVLIILDGFVTESFIDIIKNREDLELKISSANILINTGTEPFILKELPSCRDYLGTFCKNVEFVLKHRELKNKIKEVIQN